MPILQIRSIPDDVLKKLKILARQRGVPRNSVQEMLRQEIIFLAETNMAEPPPILLYGSSALAAHFVAEKVNGSRWLLPSNCPGEAAWEKVTLFEGTYPLHRLPDFMAKLFLPPLEQAD